MKIIYGGVRVNKIKKNNMEGTPKSKNSNKKGTPPLRGEP